LSGNPSLKKKTHKNTSAITFYLPPFKHAYVVISKATEKCTRLEISQQEERLLSQFFPFRKIRTGKPLPVPLIDVARCRRTNINTAQRQKQKKSRRASSMAEFLARGPIIRSVFKPGLKNDKRAAK